VRGAVNVQRGAKIALASGIVLSGLISASLFRKPPQASNPADAEPAQLDGPLASLLAKTPSSAAQLSDQIDPLVSPEAPSMANGAGDARPPASTSIGHEFDAEAARTLPSGGAVDSRVGPKPQILPRRRQTHRVRDGDTLSSLARDYLGSSKRFLEIYEANRDVLASPDLLPIGAELKLPFPDEVARQPAPEAKVERPLEPLSPQPAQPAPPPPPGVKRTYRVKAGDTLAAIAKQFYGDGERYEEIYEANRQRLQVPDDLREGLLLDIP
jgi:nucleoid-associated protein YgaU